MAIPTEDDDLAAAGAALRAAGASDPDEARRFVAMFRALEAARPAQLDPPVLMAGFTLQSNRPVGQVAAMREMLERTRTDIADLLATLPSG